MPGRDQLDALLDWLAVAALEDAGVEAVLERIGTGLNAAGVPVARINILTATLHPLIRAFGALWRHDTGLAREVFPHRAEAHPGWLGSPLKHMIDSGTRQMRCRLDDRAVAGRFPIFGEFAAQGLTDWLAVSVPFGASLALPDWDNGDLLALPPDFTAGVIMAVATARPGGFTDDEIAALDRIGRALAVVVKLKVVDGVAHDVLGAYLGADAARRVLSGAVRRGAVTGLAAVVMMADVKGFTRFSNERPIEEVLARLNATFDVLAAEVGARGGHILKFMGDGALAIFLLEGRPDEEVAAAALAAAEAVQRRLPAGVALDIALHVGDVQYGNIGAADRLDFTAIGPAVNAAARIEGLCGALDRPVLVSADLARLAPAWSDRLEPLGAHPLKGFDRPREVLGLRVDRAPVGAPRAAT